MASVTSPDLPRPYQGLEHVRATWVKRITNPDGSIGAHRAVVASASDGRFGTVEYDTIEGKTSPRDQFAKYFVFGEGKKLWVAYAEGSRYTETTLPREPGTLDPAPQLARAPWARVGAWLDEMQLRGIQPAPLGAGIRYEATDIGREGTFAIEFGAHGELTAVEFGLQSSRLRWEYAEFRDEHGFPVPHLIRDYALVTRDGVEHVEDEGFSRLESFEADTPEVLESARFNPDRMNVRYFDESTGDVYSPDKSKRLFTIHEEGRANAAGSIWWSRSWLLGVIAAAGASLWGAWSRWKQPRS